MFDFLSKKISSLFERFSRTNSLTEASVNEFLATVHDALLDADVPLDVTKAFIEDVRSSLVGAEIRGGLKADEYVTKVVYERLTAFLGGEKQAKEFSLSYPATILVMGLQGSGKTTTIAKLAHLLIEKATQARGKTPKIVVGSVDFYRPAAIDQLEILAKQVGINFYRPETTQPLQAAKELLRYQKENGYDVLIIDTAGRLHVNQTMLSELKEIQAAVQPTLKLLVLDAMTGQESLHVAQAFNSEVGFDGAILTKLDSDTRGGAAFSFRYALKKPVLFIGTGEKSDDLETFHPRRAASRILGMGDIESLIEKAEAKIKAAEQEQIARAMKSGKMTLNDFAHQLEMITKLGSLQKLMKYLPGMGQVQVSAEQLEEGDREMKRFKAILSSMTKKERLVPQIIDGSRKKRIARGAGVSVNDVQNLLGRFNEMQQMLQKFGGAGRNFGRR